MTLPIRIANNIDFGKSWTYNLCALYSRYDLTYIGIYAAIAGLYCYQLIIAPSVCMFTRLKPDVCFSACKCESVCGLSACLCLSVCECLCAAVHFQCVSNRSYSSGNLSFRLPSINIRQRFISYNPGTLLAK